MLGVPLRADTQLHLNVRDCSGFQLRAIQSGLLAEVGKRGKGKGKRERDFPLFPFTLPPISTKFMTFARGLLFVGARYYRALSRALCN